MQDDRSSGRSDDAQPRRSDRIPLTAEVALRRPGQHSFRVNICDLSRHGAKVEFVERPRCLDRVWVKIEGLAPLEGSVRWVDGFVGGIEFDRPIHPAVFDALAARLR